MLEYIVIEKSDRGHHGHVGRKGMVGGSESREVAAGRVPAEIGVRVCGQWGPVVRGVQQVVNGEKVGLVSVLGRRVLDGMCGLEGEVRDGVWTDGCEVTIIGGNQVVHLMNRGVERGIALGLRASAVERMMRTGGREQMILEIIAGRLTGATYGGDVLELVGEEGLSRTLMELMEVVGQGGVQVGRRALKNMVGGDGSDDGRKVRVSREGRDGVVSLATETPEMSQWGKQRLGVSGEGVEGVMEGEVSVRWLEKVLLANAASRVHVGVTVIRTTLGGGLVGVWVRSDDGRVRCEAAEFGVLKDSGRVVL